MKYFDIHSHFNFSEYEAKGDSREAAIKRMLDADIATITVGTNFETSKQAVELAQKYENIYATVGLHPTDVEDIDMNAYEVLARNPKVVAIGECGLDYFHKDVEVSKQKEVFIKMIELANKVNKPLMLHIRSGKTGPSAYTDAFEILKAHAKVKGNLHFFVGSIEEAKPYLDLGFTFSFTGVITFARDYDEVIKFLPLDKIMSETDAPFVAPAPYRGKRNEPLYVREVAHKIAEIRGEPLETVLPQLVANAEKMFLNR